MALVLDATDISNIHAARLAGGSVWYNPNLDYLRTKIKNYFIVNDLPKCCYCSRLFVGEFRWVIDVEHILPQSLFDGLMFNPQNLNVACKRCNMNIKKARIDFIHDVTLMGNDYFNHVHYKIIHPNLDVYTDHINIISARHGNFVFNKYVIKNNHKGKYTYEYFELENLEINNLNQAQGMKPKNDLSTNVSTFLKRNLLRLLSRL